jgi:hypothetical protein
MCVGARQGGNHLDRAFVISTRCSTRTLRVRRFDCIDQTLPFVGKARGRFAPGFESPSLDLLRQSEE